MPARSLPKLHYRTPDLTGRQFGRLRVVELSHYDVGSHWHCYCSCGTTITVKLGNLQSGNTTSCGCFRKELFRSLRTTHGRYRTPEHVSWMLMKGRCLNPNSDNFSNYGGRGIRVCDRWLSSTNFLNDMGEKPTPNHSIERINNNGHYEPGNCRWATNTDQVRNRRVTIIITYRGVAKPLAVWADIFGISYKSISRRIGQGWPVDRALETPLMGVKV